MIDEAQLNQILRPVSPPRVLDGVYSEEQYQRILDAIRSGAPWPTITAHHFDTVEELLATSNGGVPERLDLTLDDIATAHFRGIPRQGLGLLLSRDRGLLLQPAGSSIWSGTTGARRTPPDA